MKNRIRIQTLLLAVFLTIATLSFAGIEGTGFSSRGVIARLSSVVLNGVVYETNNSIVSINGFPGSPVDLAVGQTVDIHGTVNLDGVTGTADVIRIEDALRGQIESVNLGQNTFTIAEQNVAVLRALTFGRSSRM
ncbi:MAG: hypothetical protein AAF438_13125, partial [Pseudomonadota bacterium]